MAPVKRLNSSFYVTHYCAEEGKFRHINRHRCINQILCWVWLKIHWFHLQIFIESLLEASTANDQARNGDYHLASPLAPPQWLKSNINQKGIQVNWKSGEAHCHGRLMAMLFNLVNRSRKPFLKRRCFSWDLKSEGVTRWKRKEEHFQGKGYMAGQIAYKENEEPKEVHVVEEREERGGGAREREREKEKAVGMYRRR